MFRAGDPWLGGVPVLRVEVTDGTTWGGSGGQRWRGVIAKGKGVSSRGDKNVLKLIMVMRIC